MFALIIATYNSDEPVLLATARTLKAAQRRWHEHVPGNSAIKLAGFLTPSGLVNYYGKPLKPAIGVTGVKVKMEVS